MSMNCNMLVKHCIQLLHQDAIEAATAYDEEEHLEESV